MASPQQINKPTIKHAVRTWASHRHINEPTLRCTDKWPTSHRHSAKRNYTPLRICLREEGNARKSPTDSKHRIWKGRTKWGKVRKGAEVANFENPHRMTRSHIHLLRMRRNKSKFLWWVQFSPTFPIQSSFLEPWEQHFSWKEYCQQMADGTHRHRE